jgi:hypothetical protein
MKRISSFDGASSDRALRLQNWRTRCVLPPRSPSAGTQLEQIALARHPWLGEELIGRHEDLKET